MSPLSETSQLLTQGGDVRIETTPPYHKNPYGCAPFPDPELLDFGSCTASVVSSEGFAAAEALRQKLLARNGGTTLSHAMADEAHRIRQELAHLCGLSGMPDIRIILAPSGTDAHRVAAQHLYPAESEPLIVMAEPAESGSGVPAALATGHRGHVISVNVREPDGQPRAASAMDAEVTSLTLSALAAERPVLIVLTDVSKSGLIAPSPGCIAQLHQHAPERITVLVDACQFRLSSATLRAYLDCGFAVTLTGSKFVGGPSFSGALLIPSVLAARLHGALAPETRSMGPLLRWEAALQSLRQFRNLPEDRVHGFLGRFAGAIIRYIAQHPQLESLPVAPLTRQPVAADNTWDAIQTIFPFLLYHQNSRGWRPLTREGTLKIFQRLPEGPPAALRGRLGQPVLCGNRHGIPVSALRLCVSARTIIAALQNGEEGEKAVIREARAVLDKAAALAATEIPTD